MEILQYYTITIILLLNNYIPKMRYVYAHHNVSYKAACSSFCVSWMYDKDLFWTFFVFKTLWST